MPLNEYSKNRKYDDYNGALRPVVRGRGHINCDAMLLFELDDFSLSEHFQTVKHSEVFTLQSFC